MISILAAITSDMPYLYNANQAVLEECYTDDTTLVYNKNIQQITVQLTPTNKTDCFAFPSGVEAQLILRDTNNSILQSVVSDFDYASTHEIVFKNVRDIADETFAVMHIFSYSEITEVDIFIFEEQKSALRSCYISNSSVVIEEDQANPGNDEIIIKITSTGLCSEQILTIVGSNELTHVELNILGTKIVLDETEFSGSYSQIGTETSIIESNIPVDQLEGIKQQAVLSGSLEFTSKEGQTEVTFMHTLGSITVKGKDFKVSSTDIDPDDQAVVDKMGMPTFWHPNYVVIGLWNDKFICRAENHPLFAKYLAPRYDALDFTQYTVRLTAVNGDRQVSIENTTFKSKWNYSERIFSFKCTQGADDEEAECKQFYKDAMKGGVTFMFDVLFYSGSQFLFVEKIQLHEVPSCWGGAVVEEDRAGICVELLTRDNVDRCNALLPTNKTVKSILTFQFMNASNEADFSLPENYVYDFVELNRNEARYCIKCELITFDLALTPEYWRKSCAANQQRVLAKNMSINVMLDSADPAYFFEASGLIVVTDRTTRVNYAVMQITSVIFGIIFVIWAAVITIIGIIGMRRTLKQAKRKKAQ